MLGSILDFLNQAAFHIAGSPTTIAEILGFVTGGLSVFLVARNNILTFPVGILNAAFFFVLFIDAKLYADAWLQVFFLAIQIVGWVSWLKAGPNRTELRVSRAAPVVLLPALTLTALLAYLLVPVLRDAHGAYPVADSSTTALSVAAQTLMCLRVVQHWYLWIAADLIYIPLYAAKGLYFTSALYVIFLALCITGLRNWRRILRDDDPAPVVRPVMEEVTP